ncbi:MAG: HAMP domain-containing histidine kinase [Firmicutes bacterium]|nr:HAMP domain-containing histidine kinase [Bacillota bacterium]
MTIIKRTRLKLFAVMAVIIFTIITAFCASILISTYSKNANTAYTALEQMILSSNVPDRPGSTNLPSFPNDRPNPPNTQIPGDRFNDMRGFTVKLNPDFSIVEARFSTAVFTEAEISEYVKRIHKTERSDGEVDNIKFLIKDTQNGKILVCLDTSVENALFRELLITVLLAGGGGLIILLVLVWFLSYWIIKPTAAAFSKQKRFISEAGHELKTPLTVISASLELLQRNFDGTDDEKWIKNIKDQAAKMNAMTSQLLALSKIDETEQIAKTEFDLSQIVLSECLAFESVAFESGKTFICETDNDLIYKGNCLAVRQAVGILCDNAIKYSVPNGRIEAWLRKQSSKLVFTVSNESNAVKKEEIPLLFERFFRGSESRADIGGAGLGLAILKRLAEQNGWKTDVAMNQNIITFSIIF